MSDKNESKNENLTEKMNLDEIKKQAMEYLSSHFILTMATSSSEGEPDATALEYANNGFDVYVTCRPSSRKVKYAMENPRVFYEIHDETKIEWEHVKNLKAIQCSGSIKIIKPDDSEFDEAFQIMLEKYPVFQRFNKNKRVVLKFVPKKIWFLNYRKKFFHRDEISFE